MAVTPSLTVSVGNRNPSIFVVADTSDYDAQTVNSTDLTVVFPDNTTVTVDIYPENFPAESATYNITPTLLGKSYTDFPDGVYSFKLSVDTTPDGADESELTFYLMKVNTQKSWAESFETSVDNENEIEDEVKEKRTDVRELMQAAQEHFEFFRYTKATEAIERALLISNSDC